MVPSFARCHVNHSFQLVLHDFSTMVFVGEAETVLNGSGPRNVVESRTTKKNPLTIRRATAACRYQW